MSLNSNLMQNKCELEENGNEQYFKTDAADTSSTSSSVSNSFASDPRPDDNVHEQDEVESEEENDYEAEQEEEYPDEPTNPPSGNMNELYRQSLVTQRMMQLMCSTSASSSSENTDAPSSSGPTSCGTENEKENIPICKYCNKQFANFSNLNHHISAIHLNQSKWVCSQCGKVCSSKSNLKVHLRVHLRVKPYHCRWCTYSCMHHSSIRDHLTKVHPDKSHTPLQPGYMFNSQAVPEPEVFNSKGFSVNSFVDESKVKRANESHDDEYENLDETNESIRKPASPERRKFKKAKLSNENVSNSQQIKPPSIQTRPVQSNIQNSSVYNHQEQQQFNHSSNIVNQELNSQLPNMANPQLSYQMNLYRAYMGMLPLMYPMHHFQQQHQQPPLNHPHQQLPNISSINQHQSRAIASNVMPNLYMQQESNNLQFNSQFINNNSSSDEQHSTSSSSGNISYSGSSRSSSLSPANKSSASVSNKRTCDQITSTDDTKTEKIIVARDLNGSSSTETKSLNNSVSASNQSQTKKTHTIEQMLSSKTSKETQTDFSLLKCPYCTHCCL